ncbi:MAG TPA: hypothetical protein VHR45_24825 [Thermoanaerobaculia bacterium]|nr:hypothetical protein [Thermoanaerobaculia bacterium]
MTDNQFWKELLARLAVLSLLTCLGLPLAARAERIEQRVPVAAGRELKVDLEAPGSITIRGTNGNLVVVVVELEGRDATDTEVAVEPTRGGGARLTSRFARHKEEYRSKLRIEVRVPRRFGVQLLSMGGSVGLEGLDGEFDGRTMSGDLELTELSGKVDLKTMSGNIRVRLSKLDGSLTTLAGNVQFNGVEGGVEGKTMSGKVSGKATCASHAIKIVSFGDLNIGDAPDGADLKTMRGNVLVRSAAVFVKAFTGAGNIVIDRIDGQIDARSISGDIRVNMEDGLRPGSHAARLESQSGEVHLVVPANLAMDIDIKIVSTASAGSSYRVHSDFPLKIEQSSESGWFLSSPRLVVHATGRQGAATHRIELRAVNGDVYLTRSR